MREVGHPPFIDGVRADDDTALRLLPKHLGQADDRNRAGADHVGQHLPRPDGGELVDVADQKQRG